MPEWVEHNALSPDQKVCGSNFYFLPVFFGINFACKEEIEHKEICLKFLISLKIFNLGNIKHKSNGLLCCQMANLLGERLSEKRKSA